MKRLHLSPWPFPKSKGPKTDNVEKRNKEDQRAPTRISRFPKNVGVRKDKWYDEKDRKPLQVHTL
jgi:hypothetical protein